MATGADAARRLDELFANVVAPLVLGGKIRPVRPIGPRLAVAMSELAEAFTPSDGRCAEKVHQARLRRALSIAPVDRVGPIDASQTLLVAAWNDLLQTGNPYLRTVFTTTRPLALLDATRTTISLVSPPRDLADVLARHATFAAALRTFRTDVHVRWWTGSAVFRGESPPKRLLAWPEARRVRTEETKTPVDEIATHVGIAEGTMGVVLNAWLARTPLTDLAFAGRASPPFRWTRESLAVVATPAGRAMARRATAPSGVRAELAMTAALDPLGGDAKRIAQAFVELRRSIAAR